MAEPVNALVNVQRALARYEILDSAPEPAFDSIARRAAEALGTPMAGISFFDLGSGTPREWFKSALALPAPTGDALALADALYLPVRAWSTGGSSPLPRTFVIPDTLAERRARDHRWVSAESPLCFYAGAIVQARSREPIGLIAVFDRVSRDIKPRDLDVLVNLADLVTARLEARIAAKQAAREGRRSMTQAAAPAAPGGAARADEHVTHLTSAFVKLEQTLEDEIAERQAAELKLRHEKEFSDAAIASLPGAFFLIDTGGAVKRWNESFAVTTGFRDAEIIDRPAIDFIAAHDRAAINDAFRRVIERGEEVSLEADIVTRDGDEAPYSFHGRPLDIGGKRYCIGVGRDISERRRTERAIRDAKERLDLALAGSSLTLWDWDLATNEVLFSEKWGETIGARPTAREGNLFRGEEVISWCHPDDRERFSVVLASAIKGRESAFECEYRMPGAEGEWVWLHSSGKVAERDARGLVRRMTGTTANVSHRKAAEERVEFLATRDALTKLPNRILLNDRLEQGLAHAARKGTRLAFMFIDLDRFKTINDSLGHDVGDELLKRVAARLGACVRASDTVARLGGDEFAVILENLPQGGRDAQNVAEKMIASLAAPIQVGPHQLNTSCSVGIGVYPADGTDAQTLMKHADVAMYDAKAKGRNNYQFFSPAMNVKAQERLFIETALRIAPRRNELLLHYQPRVSFSTGEVTGVEALLRWQHPQQGLLLPERFIGVAEDSGLIVSLGEWVFDEAFGQVADWRRRSGRDLGVAVNLSPGQVLNGERLLKTIEAALARTALDPHVVELELTERTLLKNTEETAALLQRLGELGIGVAIDDFGTGYSSLSSLKQLPVDSIKIDSSFVRDIGTDPNDEAIIRAIVAMTHSLKLNVVAEGVEREDQYRVLRGLDCDEYQGYYFSKPLPPEEFEATFLDCQEE